MVGVEELEGDFIVDRDVIQENTLLLLMRWKFLRAATDPHAFRHLGFEPETAEALVGLDEPQVKRAAMRRRRCFIRA